MSVNLRSARRARAIFREHSGRPGRMSAGGGSMDVIWAELAANRSAPEMTAKRKSYEIECWSQNEDWIWYSQLLCFPRRWLQLQALELHDCNSSPQSEQHKTCWLNWSSPTFSSFLFLLWGTGLQVGGLYKKGRRYGVPHCVTCPPHGIDGFHQIHMFRVSSFLFC
jgi:hypothetical protein